MYALHGRDNLTSQAIEAELEKMARDGGAVAFVPVDPSRVVTAHWVRLRCQYGCKYYGTRLTCPPYSPTPEDTRKVLDEFRKAYLVKFEGFMGFDAYPPGDMYGSLKKASTKACDIGFEMERHAFLAGYYKAYLYGAHRCYRCDACALEEGSTRCRFPAKARPSMESAGIDVFATAKNAGIEMGIIRDRIVLAPEMLPSFLLLLLE